MQADSIHKLKYPWYTDTAHTYWTCKSILCSVVDVVHDRGCSTPTLTFSNLLCFQHSSNSSKIDMRACWASGVALRFISDVYVLYKRLPTHQQKETYRRQRYRRIRHEHTRRRQRTNTLRSIHHIHSCMQRTHECIINFINEIPTIAHWVYAFRNIRPCVLFAVACMSPFSVSVFPSRSCSLMQ